MTETALLVPVLEAEPATSARWPLWEPAKAQGMPAHITLLYPFLPPERLDEDVLRELDGLFAGVSAFRFALTGTGRFQEEFLYLAPEPAEPFVRLTEALTARWPEAPPYGGTVDTITPHLTALHHSDEELLERAARELAAELPIEGTAREVWLMLKSDDSVWSLHRRFALDQAGVA
jgi:2'-5' RNA ligase